MPLTIRYNFQLSNAKSFQLEYCSLPNEYYELYYANTNFPIKCSSVENNLFECEISSLIDYLQDNAPIKVKNNIHSCFPSPQIMVKLNTGGEIKLLEHALHQIKLARDNSELNKIEEQLRSLQMN